MTEEVRQKKIKVEIHIEQLFEMTIENKLLQDLIYRIEYLEIKSLY